MREILYRAKNAKGEWEYGVPLIGGLNGEVAYITQMHSYNHWVEAETIGQYTGLLDKNGVRIFDGDIIKHHRTLWGEDASDFGIVYWDGDTCRFLRTSKISPSETPTIGGRAAESYEVIGNIFDDLDLAKELGYFDNPRFLEG